MSHGDTITELRRWSTPAALFDELHREFKFDIDLCADDDNAKLPHYIRADRSMASTWLGLGRGWLNPPYGKEIGAWLEKALWSAQRGAFIVALVPGRTNAPWWHDIVMKAAEVRFIRSKVPFVDHNGKNTGVPPYGSVIAVFGRTFRRQAFKSWSYPRRCHRDLPSELICSTE
jgi:phage N-6-adenine-methyltransferase